MIGGNPKTCGNKANHPMIGGDPKTFRESTKSSDQVSTEYVLLGTVDLIINLRIPESGLSVS